MGIGSVTSINSMSGMQMITASSTDPKIKNIENEITNVQQQMQKLSSKEDLSVNEKTNERQKLQQEKSSLNTELKQHQEQLRKSQKREIMTAELQKGAEPAKKEKSKENLQPKEISPDKPNEKNLTSDKQQPKLPGTIIAQSSDGVVILKGSLNQDEETKTSDQSKEENSEEKKTENSGNDTSANASLSHKEIHSIVSADASVQQANRQGVIIASIKDDIAILKGEINQDEERGTDTEKKQAELEKMEKKEQRAMTFQFSILGEANNAMKSSSKANAPGIKGSTQISPGNNAFINSLKISQQEGQAAQQMFHMSFLS